MNSTSFRRSLEDKIRLLYGKTAIPISRYRKIIAFNRFLARLVIADPDGWVLKGGYLMELQFHQKARSTKDIDLLFVKSDKEIQKILRKACKIRIDDGFSFEIGTVTQENQGGEKIVRYQMKALLDSRTFESFHVDINNHDLILTKTKFVNSGDILSIPEFKPFPIPCYSFEQQIAEKFHALTRTYESGEASRVKDLVDILLVASIKKLSFTQLRKFVNSTFKNRNTHVLPTNTPEISSDYEINYLKLTREVGLKQKTLKQANAALKIFFLPILTNQHVSTWNPDLLKWS
jgi:hypothetical protein